MAKDKSKKAARRTPLFDIRLNTPDRDVIVLKGAPSEAAPVLLSGVVVMSITEPVVVKKMTLRFFAQLDMQWDERYQNSKGTVYSRPLHYNKIVFDYEWDTLDLQRFLGTPASSPTKLHTRHSSSGFVNGHSTHSSSSSLNILGTSPSAAHIQRNRSSSSVVNLLGSTPAIAASIATSQPESVTLQAGNYEFPFKTILPGSIMETVDSLNGSFLVYRLQSIIERGRFSNPIITRRLVHVVRTLSADSPELSETVAVDNTWPGKVDYSITVPTRAIAVGSTAHINIIMVPLTKGLKLGTIKIKLAEYSSMNASKTQHCEEKHLSSRTVPKVDLDEEGKDIWTESEVDADGIFYRNSQVALGDDRWEIQTSIPVPPSLAKVTQDCDIRHSFKVRHKLKFSIGLINPDGHVSELRATLPVVIFISPFMPIRGKTLKDYDAPHQLNGYDDATLFTPGDEILFQTHEESPVVSASHSPSQSTMNLDTQDLMAPPSYGERVYDRLYDSSSPPSSVAGVSGSTNVSSESHSRVTSPDNSELPLYNELNMAPTSVGSSVDVIRSHLSHRPSPVFTFAGDDHESVVQSPISSSPAVIAGPAFEGHAIDMSHTMSSSSGVNLPGLISPVAYTPVQHLSRATSFSTSPMATPGDEREDFNWNTEQLSRVPSYTTAIKADAVLEDDLTPAYSPQENTSISPVSSTQINLDVLDSRLQNVHTARMQRPGMSRMSSAQSMSRTPSKGSSNVLHPSPKFGSTTSLLTKQLHKIHIDGGNTGASHGNDTSNLGKKSMSFGNLSILHKH